MIQWSEDVNRNDSPDPEIFHTGLCDDGSTWTVYKDAGGWIGTRADAAGEIIGACGGETLERCKFVAERETGSISDHQEISLSRARVWQFWTGPAMPEMVRACVASVELRNDERMANEIDLRLALDDCGLPASLAQTLKPTHQSDFLRAFLLAKHGGWWADTDYLCFRPLADCLPVMNRAHTMALYRGEYSDGVGYLADVMFALPGSPMAAAYLGTVVDYLKKYERAMGWDHLGARALNQAARTRAAEICDIPPDKIAPYRIMASNLDAEIKRPLNIFPLRDTTVGVTLLYSQSRAYLDKASVEDWRKSNTMIGLFLRAAEPRTVASAAGAVVLPGDIVTGTTTIAAKP